VIWDGETLAWRRPAETVGQYGGTIAFSPDGTLLVSAEYDAVALYAVATGEVVLREQYKQTVF
jgi:hypothetical protein